MRTRGEPPRSRTANPGIGKDTFLAQARAYYRSLPRDRFPTIAGRADELLRDVGDERFEFGPDLMLSGPAAQAPRV